MVKVNSSGEARNMRKLRVLMVDDSVDDYIFLNRMTQNYVELHWLPTFYMAKRYFEDHRPSFDFVILDRNGVTISGWEAELTKFPFDKMIVYSGFSSQKEVLDMKISKLIPVFCKSKRQELLDFLEIKQQELE